MKRTPEKDTLSLTYTQLGEIRDKTFSLIHKRGVDKKDIDVIRAMIRRTYLQLTANSKDTKDITVNEHLNF